MISEVLKAKHSIRWVEPVISKDSTLGQAIMVCIEAKLSGMMVVDRGGASSAGSIEKSSQKCVGLLTSRDLLRIIAAGMKDGKTADEILSMAVTDQMTPINQVIYGRPNETIGMCRAIMGKLGIKCLPILSGSRVEGILTTRDLSDFYFDAQDKGGKKHYLTNVSGRIGLTGASMAEAPMFLRGHLALSHDPLFLNVGVAEYPHPYKFENGVGGNRRGERYAIDCVNWLKSVCDTKTKPQTFSTVDYGFNQELSSDPALSEDAYFIKEVELLDESGENMQKLLYMAVADGVGSWREYGVDPRDFSHRLMEECENVLDEASSQCHLTETKDKKFCRMLSPAELLAKSYERTKAANIIGSSTVCVGLFDSVHHQLHFSNIGDSGILVLRHIDSDVAGALRRDKTTPRVDRKSDLRVAFVSQQQLKSFNHPFQVGWTGEEINDPNASFKNASESCTSSVHILRGDIIIMATDGLFDNVDVDDIASIALEWEQKYRFIDEKGRTGRNKRWASGNSLTNLSAEAIPSLAETLCKKARENSLDSSIDSPFALLAKDNDIMWSGGECLVNCIAMPLYMNCILTLY
jgi:protein phosphatase PTC7